MNLNVPYRVRAFLYAFTAVATPVIGYLGNQGKLTDFYVGLYTVFVTAVMGLAFSKVTPDQEK